MVNFGLSKRLVFIPATEKSLNSLVQVFLSRVLLFLAISEYPGSFGG